MNIILKSIVLTAALALSLLIFAADGAGGKLNLNGMKPAVETIESDCPACGWSLKEKRSNDKPAEGFEGVFEPGTTCPFCEGKGKLFDTIDWKNGTVAARGVALSEEKGEFAQEKLLAQRGAKVVALRNAAADVMQVRLSPGRKMPKSYERKLDAFVNNFEVSSYVFADKGKKPAVMAVVVVPLWGVKSVAAEVFDSEKKRYVDASGRNPAKEAAVESWTEETIIVVDVRESEYEPNMFPVVVDEEDAPVYDISHVKRKYAVESGAAKFVELGKADKSFDDLKKDIETGSLIVKSGDGMFAALAPENPLVFEDGAKSADNAAEGGKTAPAGKAQLKKRTIVVKGGVKTDGKQTKISVSKTDAKLLNEAEQSGGAKTSGKVVIITNAASGK